MLYMWVYQIESCAVTYHILVFQKIVEVLTGIYEPFHILLRSNTLCRSFTNDLIHSGGSQVLATLNVWCLQNGMFLILQSYLIVFFCTFYM
jgi:hypothetical protein